MLKPVLALLAFAAAPAAAQQLTPAEAARIDQLVTRTLAESGVPSASIAIVRDGKIVLAKAWGKANEALPASPALPYQIASNSKQFTAMALLLLEDEGKLRLDDKVAKYLPQVTGGDRITLRQLLDHTSGIQDFWPQDYSFAAMSHPTAPQGIVDRWARKPLDFAPGDQWQYSNTAYVVAGIIAEKVSGEPLLAYLNRKIFKPLDMHPLDQDETNTPAFPAGYGRYALGPLRLVDPPASGWLYAAGELSMTAEDLAKWDIARINRSLLPADDWAAQETPTKLNDGTDTNYGLGVGLRTVGGRRVIRHTGEAVGFLSVNDVFPKERVAVVVLTNSWNTGSAYTRLAREIENIVLPPPPAAGPDAATVAAQAAQARKLFDQLRSGTLDRALLTDNASFYFTPQAVADFRSSLGPLGEPVTFEADGKPVLRGGFVIQGYTVKYANRSLELSTFYEPGRDGRIEQFLVSPAE